MEDFKCKNYFYLEPLPATFRLSLEAGKIFRIEEIRGCHLEPPRRAWHVCNECIFDYGHSTKCVHKLNGECKGYLFITSKGEYLPARAYRILTKIEATVHSL